MYALHRRIFNKLFALVAVMLLGIAQPAVSVAAPQPFQEAELDQLLAPIALYPDPLLSQILMAATYPIEVVEAARWSRANPRLRGEDAVMAVDDRDWDPSVKSLVAFPNILERMDQKIDWMRDLGDAFLAQEEDVMDTIQRLRQRAAAAGSLYSDERQRIIYDGNVIIIEPVNPMVVYVPYYDPLVVYGRWWWNAYPPVSWAPWPGYVAYRSPRPGVSVGFSWGPAISISSSFFFGVPDWRERHVQVRPEHRYYQQRPPERRNGAIIRSRPNVIVVPGQQRRVEPPVRWERRGPVQRRIERREENRGDARPDGRRDDRRDARRNERKDDKRDARPNERKDVRKGEQRPGSNYDPAGMDPKDYLP